MSISQRLVDEDRLAQKVHDRLMAQEAEIETQEAAEAARREQQAWFERQAQEQQADVYAVEQLRGLLPLYEKRKQLAETAAHALADFCKAESELKSRLSALDVRRPPGLDDRHAVQRLQALRARAGLAPGHWQIGIETPALTDAERMARVALAALARGWIGPRSLTVHTKSVVIDTDEGV